MLIALIVASILAAGGIACLIAIVVYLSNSVSNWPSD